MNFLEQSQRLTSEGTVAFLEVSAPSIVGVLRLANDNREWVSRGETYLAAAFGIEPPDDVSGQAPRGVLTIGSRGKGITADLEGMDPGDTLMARLMLASKSAPDVYQIDMSLPVMVVTASVERVTATIGMEPKMRQQAVRLRFTPFRTPGAFA